MGLIPFFDKKIILDLCGGTGTWSKPYADAGYDVRVITWPNYDARLWPSKRSKSMRLPKEFDDIRIYIGKIYGILAAPPCTVFAGSGARWKRTDEDMIEGISILDACIRIIFVLKPNGFWVLENPVGKINKWLGNPIFTFNPCDFGDPYTKKTHLWGKFNLPKKNPVEPTEGSKIQKKLFGWQKEERSITPTGFAKAFFEANK